MHTIRYNHLNAEGDPMSQLTSNNTQSIYYRRQERLRQALKYARLDGLALNPGPSLTYLTGLSFHLSERPVVALFTPEQIPVLILPELESAKVANLDYPMQSFPYGEELASWGGVFAQGIRSAGLTGKTVGLEPRRMRVLELNLIEEASAQTKFQAAEELITEIRMYKDQREAQNMRRAVQIAQEALLAALPTIQVGITERQFAAELTLQLLRHGSDPEIPFSPIVSGGPNSANPHASPSDRPLQNGDLLVIDWGAAYGGYISDLTRTFAIGEVEPEFRQIGLLVQKANEAGRNACKPGISAGTVDQAARDVIVSAGYGPFFFHRTGHGIGMEGHEDPYIRDGNTLILKPGMTFTIEPGIYLPERGGVRIEDNVMITPEGMECFSDLPREVRTLPL
jgi:Xaa-Pro dipeptidase